MRVVVLHVVVQHPRNVASADDEQSVQTLSAQAAEPALHDRVRPGRPHRGAEDPDALRAEHLVDGCGELRVPVPDEEAQRGRPVVNLLMRLRACWVTHSPVGCAVTPATCTIRVCSSMKTSTYSRRKKTVSTVTKSQARQVCPSMETA